MLSPATKPQADTRRTALNFAAGALWYCPASFGIARMLGPRYSLRCVLFHNIAETESPFTKGLGGTMTPRDFESALGFLTKHYTPVGLQDVLASYEGQSLPDRPVLVTFDDAYASIREVAAPLCAEQGVPAVFFVNASCLDNRRLAMDNLLCYVANEFGLDAIQAAKHTLEIREDLAVNSLADVFHNLLPSISLDTRQKFRDTLLRQTGIDESDLAGRANLYLTSQQLRELAAFNFEIGNHTYTHVHGRPMSGEDFAEEIDKNKIALEAASGTRVRSFSVPYGSSADLTPALLSHMRDSGYEAIFLAEGRANSLHADRARLDRVSITAKADAAFFSEIEVLPRLRRVKDGLAGSRNEAGHASPEFADRQNTLA
jgi:peptidoglycan/xylan/chitin deacetylase (PgdA/CDA1 family)